MPEKKISVGFMIFVLIILSVFAAPFIYRTVSFYKTLSEYDYQEIPLQAEKGLQVKTILEISEDVDIKVYRNRQWYQGGWRYPRIADSIEHYVAPGTIAARDEQGRAVIMETSDGETFRKILDSGGSSETIDSLILYMVEVVEENLEYYEVIEGAEGASRKGEKIEENILRQFSRTEAGMKIEDKNRYVYEMDYEERMEKRAPAFLYSHQGNTKGWLVFGLFEITGTAPLTVRCVSHISDQHADDIKASVWRHWFTGLDLVTWIAFTLFFSVSMFFFVKMIRNLISGKPIE